MFQPAAIHFEFAPHEEGTDNGNMPDIDSALGGGGGSYTGFSDLSNEYIEPYSGEFDARVETVLALKAIRAAVLLSDTEIISHVRQTIEQGATINLDGLEKQMKTFNIAGIVDFVQSKPNDDNAGVLLSHYTGFSSAAGDTFAAVMSAFMMGSCGGPVVVIISSDAAKRVIGIMGNSNDKYILTDHRERKSDPIGLGFDDDDDDLAIEPLGGNSATVISTTETEKLERYIASHCDERDFVADFFTPSFKWQQEGGGPCDEDDGSCKAMAIDIDGGDGDEPQLSSVPPPVPEQTEKSKAPSPGIDLTNLVLEDEEVSSEGKRRRRQPAIGSPMKVESEESEEKRVKTPPPPTRQLSSSNVVATAIPSAASTTATTKTEQPKKKRTSVTTKGKKTSTPTTITAKKTERKSVAAAAGATDDDGSNSKKK